MVMSSVTVFAQKTGNISPGIQISSATEDSIRNTALDYGDGFYSGDVGRVTRAIHPDLNKAFPRYIFKTGQVALTYSTYSGLIEMTSAKLGFVPDTARHTQVSILSVTPDIAMVKLTSTNFNDFLQLVKLNGEWKIINVLWNSPQNAKWLKNFQTDQEKKSIELTVSGYYQGIQSGDVERIKEYVAPDLNRVTLVPIGREGRSAIQRQRFESIAKNAFAGMGRQAETQRDNTIEILDVMDGLAMVKILTARNVEYIQLYKDSDHWKLFNILASTRNDITLADLLPAITGEPMPQFSLPVFGGGEFTLSEHRGKNILLMFPRGWLGNTWCLYCPYQYLELAELEKKEQFRKKYNLEVVFVMPYGNDRIADWFAKFPDIMKTLDGYRNPAGGPVTGLQKEYSDWIKSHYPLTFDLSAGVSSKTFPVLSDEKRSLSKRLKLFTDFWDGVPSEQNISAIYLIDKEGILRWKYISQKTEDRPATDDILKVIKETMK